MRNRTQNVRGYAMLAGLGIGLVLTASQSPAVAQNGAPARVQTESAPKPTQAAPLTLTLQDALVRAQANEPLFLAAISDAKVAHEDVRQARVALFPSLGVRSEYLGTQGNGKLASGRYVTNDGVHVYRDWSIFHQDLSPGALMRTGYKRANAAEAMAQAKAEIARRGLAVTVTKAYYGLVVAQRKYAAAQQALDQAKHILSVSQALERGGEAAHSDVVKSQVALSTQEQAFRETRLAMETARLDLAVLLFRDFDENFQIVDDLHLAPALPPFEEIQAMAARQNPALRLASSTLEAANFDVSVARQAFMPSLTVDTDYGIEANAFALHAPVAAARELGPLPSLGYFVTATFTLPVWDWGARKSKLRQAQFKRDQAAVELSAAQRQAIRNVHAAYEEAQTARDQIELLRRSADLAAESLRLNNLRYQGGEATILELVDAQTTLTQARNAYDDGLARYRLALANLQTLTGPF